MLKSLAAGSHLPDKEPAMKSINSLLLMFALAFALASTVAAVNPEAWPDNPVTVTDATPDAAETPFQVTPAVYQLQRDEVTALPVTLTCQREHAAFNPIGASITRLEPAPFDPVADWRARLRVIA